MDENGSSGTSRAEARQWLLKHSSGDISSTEEMAFRVWLESSAENQRSFDDLQLLWSEFDQVSDQVLAQHGDVPASMPTRLFAVAATLLVTALFAGLLWQWQGGSMRAGSTPPPAQYSSQTGQLQTILLADGSSIELGAHSRLKTLYSEDQRLILLERGEAYFDVAPDSNRPFVVSTRGGTATAVGTAFTVHAGIEDVTVTVAEGIVAVSGAAANPNEQQIEAGNQLSYGPDGSLSTVERIPEDQLSSWRQGRRVFRNAPLDALIYDLNRYSEKSIIVADPRLQNVEVSGVFEDFADTQAVLRAIEQSLPAKVEERSGAIYLLHQ
ncbi:MAG: FecR domain-containing protein [Halioglobus sp.]